MQINIGKGGVANDLNLKLAFKEINNILLIQE